MTDELLDSAILSVRKKIIPALSASTPTVPEPHTQLYALLNVFDIPDSDVEDKVKYIYDYLLNNGGNPRDQVVSIHSQIGAMSNDHLINRVFKWCKLREQAGKALLRYENIQKEINAISHS